MWATTGRVKLQVKVQVKTEKEASQLFFYIFYDSSTRHSSGVEESAGSSTHQSFRCCAFLSLGEVEAVCCDCELYINNHKVVSITTSTVCVVVASTRRGVVGYPRYHVWGWVYIYPPPLVYRQPPPPPLVCPVPPPPPKGPGTTSHAYPPRRDMGPGMHTPP